MTEASASTDGLRGYDVTPEDRARVNRDAAEAAGRLRIPAKRRLRKAAAARRARRR